MWKQLILLLMAVAKLATAVSFSAVAYEEWENWKMEHGRNYSSLSENKFRMKVYLENKAKIARHNRLAHAGEHSFFLKMNKFGDMLHHEFVATMTGYRHDLKEGINSPTGATFLAPENVVLPNSVDWREKGYVTPIKSQRDCGSGYAFSATGSLEGQNFRKTGKLVSLSEQNLVDCSGAFGNQGCNNGRIDLAFEYIKENGGIDTEASYPYLAIDWLKCHYNRTNRVTGVVGFVDLPSGDEGALAKAVASVGPISVAVDVSDYKFQFYDGGIYYERDCSQDRVDVDHFMLVVGYGVAPKTPFYNEESFWLVKNSFGADWGEQGYIRMVKDKNNMCAIATMPSYPLV